MFLQTDGWNPPSPENPEPWIRCHNSACTKKITFINIEGHAPAYKFNGEVVVISGKYPYIIQSTYCSEFCAGDNLSDRY